MTQMGLAAAADARARPAGWLLMAGPVALTGVAVAIGFLDVPRIVLIVSIAVVAAAWALVVAWLLRRSDAPARVLTEQQALMAELREFLGQEVVGAREELSRSQRLIHEAVMQLHTSFRSMEEQSRQQGAMITCLVEQDGAGSPGVRKFADAASTLMSKLTELLAGDSRESARTVQVIGEMVRQFDEVFEVLAELKGISEQSGQLSVRAVAPNITDPRSALRAFSYDVRQLTTRASSLYERIEALVASSKVIVDRVRVRVEKAADRSMTISIEAKTRAEELVGQVIAINRSLAAGINLVSQCGLQIRRDVANAVRSLQFEDIANQAMAAATAHVDRLRALNQDAATLHDALSGLQTSANDVAHMDEFTRLLRKKRDEWRRPAHKTVSQVTMGAGSVELF